METSGTPSPTSQEDNTTYGTIPLEDVTVSAKRVNPLLGNDLQSQIPISRQNELVQEVNRSSKQQSQNLKNILNAKADKNIIPYAGMSKGEIERMNPQDVVKAEQIIEQQDNQRYNALNDEVSLGESIKNSADNAWVQLQKNVPQLQVLAADVWEKTLGKELAQDWYKWEGRDINKVRLDAYNKLQELDSELKQTKGSISDNLKHMNASGLVANLADAVFNLGSTALPAYVTGGASTVTSMTGQSIADYNNAKAKSLGKSVEKLYEDGESEIGVPLMIGGVATGLEFIGLKGAQNAMLGKLGQGSIAKKAAVLAFETNKEGMTEWMQTGLDEANKALAQGDNISEVSSKAVDKMFSKDGLNSYLMGTLGSLGAAGLGKVSRFATKPSNVEAINTSVGEIQQLETDLNNPNVSPQAKQVIQEQVVKKVEDISTVLDKDIEESDRYTPKNKVKIDELSKRSEALSSVVNDENVSEVAKATAQTELDAVTKEIESIKPENKSVEAKSEANEPITQKETETPLKTIKTPSNETNEQPIPKVDNVEEVSTPKTEETGKTTGEESVKVEKPKFTIKGETVTPKESVLLTNEVNNSQNTDKQTETPTENVNIPTEPIIGGEAKVPTEDIQSTQDDRGGNDAKTERVGTADEKIESDFDKLANKSLEGDEIRNTLSNVERETTDTLSDEQKQYRAEDRKASFRHGIEVVERAKTEFGDQYVSKLLDYVKESKMPFENKALLYVSLENDLRQQLANDPTNVKLRKQVDLATKTAIEHGRSAGRAVGMGALRRAARADYDTEQAVDAIFTPKEKEQRAKLQEKIESTSEDIQKEYESREERDAEDIAKDVFEQAKEEAKANKKKQSKESLKTERKQIVDDFRKQLAKIRKTTNVTVPYAQELAAAVPFIKKMVVNLAKEGVVELQDVVQRIHEEFKTHITGLKQSDVRDALAGLHDESTKLNQTLKQELIDAGYGKEINVKVNAKDENGDFIEENGKRKKVTEKRNILNWKALTGAEGSFENLKDALDKSFKDKGYSKEQIDDFQKQLQDEYNSIHADIIEKSINELERRNAPKEGNAKTLARRLAELYNLGLYNKEVNTYSNILNNALGISPASQEAFNEIRDFNKSLSQLIDMKNPNGKPLTDIQLSTAETEVKNHIQQVIQKTQFAEGSGFFKASVVLKNVFSAMQRMMLVKISQLVENPISGALNNIHVKLQDLVTSKGLDSKELADIRKRVGNAIYQDTLQNGGEEYGGVGNPFTSKNAIETFVNTLSNNALYRLTTGVLSGRPFLDAADSFYKIKRTEKEFTHNLIRILTDKSNPNGAMDKTEALQFVSEALTGQNFEEAKDLARSIIENVNAKAGKQMLRPAESNVIRIANDIVKDNLVNGQRMTERQVEDAFKAAYKTAGKSIGHESNNLLTDAVNNLNQLNQRKLNEALKKKDWSTAALLNITGILSKNIVNPFVGGGTNWVVIGLQKAGVPTEWFRSDVGYSKNPIDLSTKEGLKELKDNLSANATRKRMYGRMAVSTLASLSALLALAASGKEDDYEKWLKNHPEAKKLINKIQPTWVTLYLARDNKNMGLIKEILAVLGSRYNAYTDSDKLIKASNDFYKAYDKGDNKAAKKAWGVVGEVVGRRINVPYVSMISNFKSTGDKLYEEFVGKPSKDQYKASKGFTQGYFKGGMLDTFGLNPFQENDKDKKE